jgi:hypothetical protein
MRPMNLAASLRVTSNTWGPPIGLIGRASSRLKSGAFVRRLSAARPKRRGRALTLEALARRQRCEHFQIGVTHQAVDCRSSQFRQELLSSTLANFSSSSAAWDAEHRIVLDDVVGTLKHEFHAAEVAKGAPATMDVGPIKQLETIRIGDGAQPGDGI